MSLIGGEAAYAVIIICVIILLGIVVCLGTRLVRRRAKPSIRKSASGTFENEWQPLKSITPLEPTDAVTLNVITEWQSKHPPNTTNFLNAKKDVQVIDKGVSAWKFIEHQQPIPSQTTSTNTIEEEPSNTARLLDADDSTIVFSQGQGNITTNLPVPIQEFAYYEVKILILPTTTTATILAIGLATRPYPSWRLPGWHKHSVAYHSNSGAVFASDPHRGRPYGPPYSQGDVIGVGYLYQSGTVFFTRNGQNLGKASIGFKYPLYPIVGAINACSVAVNFGDQDFLFSPANVREAMFAPRQGRGLPPPAYEGHLDDVLFDDTVDHRGMLEGDVSSRDLESYPEHGLNYVDRSGGDSSHIDLPPSYS